jgi:hypothetical protein
MFTISPMPGSPRKDRSCGTTVMVNKAAMTKPRMPSVNAKETALSLMKLRFSFSW